MKYKGDIPCSQALRMRKLLSTTAINPLAVDTLETNLEDERSTWWNQARVSAIAVCHASWNDQSALFAQRHLRNVLSWSQLAITCPTPMAVWKLPGPTEVSNCLPL